MNWLIRTGFLLICATKEDSGIVSAKKKMVLKKLEKWLHLNQ